MSKDCLKRSMSYHSFYRMLRELSQNGESLSIELWSTGRIQVFYKGRFSPDVNSPDDLLNHIAGLVRERRLLFKKF